ncbi:transcriptional regulator [Gemmobacter aquarius]|uniref:Transcriptional regulator n=1 Tax=Paragemmobacter aquarius TaxID=2169400 RepID=A0A2S0UKQ7_9RHOB|nr:helix-turn-helix transcriptional regulator [Gemmobacter aquarius]AWB48398.1 transcriptional regulator [Gemmobacter aquarius]
MARAATGLGVRDLAKFAGVSPDTVARLERGEELKPSTLAALRAALTAHGATMLEDDGQAGPGVRYKPGPSV